MHTFLYIENSTNDYMKVGCLHIPPGKKIIDISSMPQEKIDEIDSCMGRTKTKGFIYCGPVSWEEYLKPHEMYIHDGSAQGLKPSHIIPSRDYANMTSGCHN